MLLTALKTQRSDNCPLRTKLAGLVPDSWPIAHARPAAAETAASALAPARPAGAETAASPITPARPGIGRDSFLFPFTPAHPKDAKRAASPVVPAKQSLLDHCTQPTPELAKTSSFSQGLMIIYCRRDRFLILYLHLSCIRLGVGPSPALPAGYLAPIITLALPGRAGTRPVPAAQSLKQGSSPVRHPLRGTLQY